MNLFGFGLAFAILVDATIVRLILVPSTMDLAGRANWWMPRWLDRILPRLAPEHTDHPARTAPTTDDARATDDRPKVEAPTEPHRMSAVTNPRSPR